MKWGFSFRDRFLALSCSAALTLVAPDGARAQLLQGTIDGNVTDSSEAAIPDAIVTTRDQQTNFIRETKTSSVGGYSLSGLPPGTYTITVSSAGFQSYTQTGIAVTPNRSEEHTSELQSQSKNVWRLLLRKKNIEK